jgi:hypothetical protein
MNVVPSLNPAGLARYLAMLYEGIERSLISL